MTHPMDVLADKIVKHTIKRTNLKRHGGMRNIVEDTIETMDNETLYSLCPNPVKIAWLRGNDPRGDDNWNHWITYTDTLTSLLQSDTANPWADAIIEHIRRHKTKPAWGRRASA